MSISRKDTGRIEYPESDGEPIADNSKQFECIVTLHGGLEEDFRKEEDVAIFSDMLWYPIEGDNQTKTAPDVMVIFGRPKGHRRSYLQWLEGGIAPQVVFEVLSHSNRPKEMTAKKEFYQRYGVQEYYIYDPNRLRMQGFLRRNDQFVEIADLNGYTSPRLGIKFVLDPPGSELQVFGRDGRRYETFLGVSAQRDDAEQKALRELHRADQAEERAREAYLQFEQERLQREEAEQRARAAEERIQELLRRLQQTEGGPEQGV